MTGRDLSRWEEILFALEDDAFFSVVRNYLGEVKTPFNKHDLIKKVVSFFRKDDVRKALTASIDFRDAEVLSLVHILTSVKEDHLFRFFEAEQSYLDLHHHLLNLEERLLLWRTRDEDEPEIRETPLAGSLFRDGIIHPGVLFETVEAGPAASGKPWLDEALILGLIAFLRSHPDTVKENGSLSRKGQEKAFAVFPHLQTETPLGSRLDMVLSLIISSKMVTIESTGAIFDIDVLKAYADAPRELLGPFLWAHIPAAFLNLTQDYLLLCSFTEALHAVFHVFQEGRAFSMKTLNRGLSLVCISRGLTPEEQESLLHTLLALELFIPVKNETSLIMKNPYLFKRSGDSHRDALLQANFEVSLSGDITLKDGLLTSLAGEIRSHDQVSSYELTKDSVRRVFHDGFSLNDLTDNLARFSPAGISQNVRFTLERWYHEFSSVEIYHGTVIKAEGDAAYIVEHSPGINDWIKEKLAPGIFLFDGEQEQKWRKLLEKAGISVPPLQKHESRSSAAALIPVKPTSFPFSLPAQTERHTRVSSGQAESWDSHAETLSALASKMSIPEHHREELKARIEKRLILSKKQLEHRNTHPGPREAKGLDYIGKIRLIEQTLQENQDLLEVIVRKPDGSPEKILIKPEDMIKRNEELHLKGYRLPGQELLELKVRKLSFVRKLKRSLFAP